MDKAMAVYLMQLSLLTGPYVAGDHPTELDIKARLRERAVPYTGDLPPGEVFSLRVFVPVGKIIYRRKQYQMYVPRDPGALSPVIGE